MEVVLNLIDAFKIEEYIFSSDGVFNKAIKTKQEVNSSYLQGKMTAYEIDKLIDELNK